MIKDKNDGIMPHAYKGREQSYVKHVFLENYIEKVAYNLLSACSDFVYIDGFSGPWKSSDEGYDDTSFAIAISKLRAVKNSYESHGKPRTVRCLFIEKDAKAFAKLQEATLNVPDVETKVLRGSFEDPTSDVITFIGRSFSFAFIDPTGWKGYSLTKISPLLQKRGEVIINFMFDYINRFIEDPRPEITNTFNPVFGDDQWFKDFSALVDQGVDREVAILRIYLDRLKRVGGFKHVTSTRIKHPEKERTYFHLVYGTNHPKGIVEFRRVEEKAAGVQERIRVGIKIDQKTDETGIDDLFGATNLDSSTREFERERAISQGIAKHKLVRILNSKPLHRFDELQGEILETPLVWVQDLNKWMMILKKSNAITIPSMGLRERVPKHDHLVHVQAEISLSLFHP